MQDATHLDLRTCSYSVSVTITMFTNTCWSCHCKCISLFVSSHGIKFDFKKV